MGEPIAVHVIDDDDVMRDILIGLLSAAGHRVHGYEAAQAFLDELPGLSGGCVITDVQMPDITGIELLRRMRARLAEFPIIVLTGNADVPLAVEALKSGASDFIEKPIDKAAVLEAVQTAMERLSRTLEQEGRHAKYAQRVAGLTGRERDVLRGLVAGRSNKAIARDLNLSPRTVENYRASLMTKTQASSFSELVRMALVTEGLA